jgi:hypothetical protein
MMPHRAAQQEIVALSQMAEPQFRACCAEEVGDTVNLDNLFPVRSRA